MLLLFRPCCLSCSVYISGLSREGCGCMIERVTMKWVTGSSKLKNNGETTTDRFRKSSPAFKKKYAIISLGNHVFFRNRINVELRIHTELKRNRRWASFCVYVSCLSLFKNLKLTIILSCQKLCQHCTYVNILLIEL